MTGNGFGLYRLGAPIGRGANGTVFSGEYGTLRRPVAVKVLHHHLVGDSSAERMLREARTISLLDHPGIVKVFDVGVANDGRAFVVMECLVGEPLSARLERGRVTEARVVTFARQLASALEVAHAAGVIHRDLKPENVFIVADPDIPGGERVKIVDFGIAKLKGQCHTATGIVLGTPAYMAPEQFRGSRDVDVRADIYSLGVILYVMATGVPPFGGKDTDELLAEHAYCKPAPPALVSRRLAAVIECCMAKDPNDRFATMTKLSAALAELVVPEPQSAQLGGDTVIENAPTQLWGDLDDTTRTAAPAPARPLVPVSPRALAASATRVARPTPRASAPLGLIFPPKPALPAGRKPQFSEAATVVRPVMSVLPDAPRPSWGWLRAPIAVLLVLASLAYLATRTLAADAADVKPRFDVAPPVQPSVLR